MYDKTETKGKWVSTGEFAELLENSVTRQTILRHFDKNRFRKTQISLGGHRKIHVTDLSNPMAEIINNK